MRKSFEAWLNGPSVSDTGGLQCPFVESVPEHIFCEQVGLGSKSLGRIARGSAMYET
jgi:hypothetical protein